MMIHFTSFILRVMHDNEHERQHDVSFDDFDNLTEQRFPAPFGCQVARPLHEAALLLLVEGNHVSATWKSSTALLYFVSRPADTGRPWIFTQVNLKFRLTSAATLTGQCPW